MLLKMPRIFGVPLILANFVGGVALAQDNSLSTALEIKPENVVQWNLKFDGKSIEEGIDQEFLNKSAQIFDVRLRAKMKYWLTGTLSVDFRPVVKFQSGRSQSLDGAENPTDSFSLKQAALRWTPNSYFAMLAGSLNQGTLHTSVVADDIPFPAFRVGARMKPGNFEFGLFGEVSVPASNSLDTNTNEVEPNPIKEALQIQMNWKPNSLLFVKNKFGTYHYKNLPSEVANQSKLLGNTTTTITDDVAAFDFEFRGVEAKTELQIPISQFDLTLIAEGARNSGAPETKNTAYLGSIGLRWHASSRNSFFAQGWRFRVESDVAPAVFSSRDLFRTNRNGYEAQLGWHLKKEKFEIKMVYKEADVIEETPAQSRVRYYGLELETDYGSL
jgi:hypothetical protein